LKCLVLPAIEGYKTKAHVVGVHPETNDIDLGHENAVILVIVACWEKDVTGHPFLKGLSFLSSFDLNCVLKFVKSAATDLENCEHDFYLLPVVDCSRSYLQIMIQSITEHLELLNGNVVVQVFSFLGSTAGAQVFIILIFVLIIELKLPTHKPAIFIIFVRLLFLSKPCLRKAFKS